MILWVCVFVLVCLLGLLAWPTVAPRLGSYRRRRRGLRRYYRN